VVYDLTEPVMGFFRRFIPPVGGLDLSPIFIFVILGFIRGGLCH
jgi:YggT family protein